MTLMRLLERIKREFPNVKDVEIVEDLDNIHKEFCHETEILKTSGNLTIVANTVSYTLSTEFPTLDKILRIDYLDSAGDFENETDQLTVDVKPDGTIRFYDYYGDDISTIAVTTIKFYYTYIPTTLSARLQSSSPEMPSQFHDALIHGELARLYARFPTIERRFPDGSTAMTKDYDSVKYHEVKYQEFVTKAKRYANTEKSSLNFKTKADQF